MKEIKIDKKVLTNFNELNIHIGLDHPTITHMLGYLSVCKWADAIRNKEVHVDLAYQLLKIQDDRYHGCMVDDVKEAVAMTDEEYREWKKSQKEE